MQDLTRILVGFIVTTALLLTGSFAFAQQTFKTPEEAEKAIVEAARDPAKATIDGIFGPGGSELLSSGDAETDKQRAEDFLDLAAKGMSVTDGDGGRKVLVFGNEGWQFPIPLRAETGGWVFDLAAGKQAVIDRAVGRNEIAAIGSCDDYVDAQTEYFHSLHDDEPVQQYARRIISSEGLHDGLWWPPADATDQSPLGDRIAASAFEGGKSGGKPRSYKGYVYKILTRQGQSAPGGAYDYLVKGRLLAGFALLAYPEKWGETGVMTFLCDMRGQVYEKNLGPRTGALAAAINALDPDTSWDALGSGGTQ